MLLLRYVLIDLGTWCCASTARDLKEITSRVEHEGLSFLTITLADFGKDFQKSLDQGSVGSDQFSAFKKTGGLPRLFSGFLCRVFDMKTGRLLDSPDITSIWAIRQITLMWAKIEIPCTPEREYKAMSSFVQCEKEVREADVLLSQSQKDDFKRISLLLFGEVLSQVDKSVYEGEIIPGHGPGSTAEKILGNEKWSQTEWPNRLEEIFPSGEYLIPSWRYREVLDHVDFLEPGSERPVRVVSVPKTQSSPRIIAVEPVSMQYVQQGILHKMVEIISRSDIPRMITGCQDQEPNQLLARKGSIDGSLATLDLSEASDRVSNQHVRLLLRGFPWLFQGVDACRSRKADVRGFGVIRLAKFAPMGSALCFPFEEMVFATVIFIGIEQELRRQLTKKDVFSLFGRVRIFGDDIVVPSDCARSVVSSLEAFGFRVNTGKSFWNGKFRESCGRDYYDGLDISIVRVRSELPSQRRHASELVSTVSLRNQLYKAGLWNATRFLDDYLAGINVPMPRIAETSPMLGRYSFLGWSHQPFRWDPELQIPLVRGLVARGNPPASELDGYAALLKCLTKRSDLPFADVRHLKRAGRPSVVNTKQKWGRPF